MVQEQGRPLGGCVSALPRAVCCALLVQLCCRACVPQGRCGVPCWPLLRSHLYQHVHHRSSIRLHRILLEVLLLEVVHMAMGCTEHCVPHAALKCRLAEMGQGIVECVVCWACFSFDCSTIRSRPSICDLCSLRALYWCYWSAVVQFGVVVAVDYKGTG